MRPPVVGVMGPGVGAREADMVAARELGRLLAVHGWVVLCGGSYLGVMGAVAEGAQQAGGLTVGVLPGDTDQGASSHLSVAIVTGMGSARNHVNVLSSDVIVACGMGLGTASEVALGLKAGRPVVLLGCDPDAEAFFLGMDPAVYSADSPQAAVAEVAALLGR